MVKRGHRGHLEPLLPASQTYIERKQTTKPLRRRVSTDNTSPHEWDIFAKFDQRAHICSGTGGKATQLCHLLISQSTVAYHKASSSCSNVFMAFKLLSRKSACTNWYKAMHASKLNNKKLV